MEHITELYLWQLDVFKKYGRNNVTIKPAFTGEDVIGYKVIDGIDAVVKHANGKTTIETYNFRK